MRLSARGSADRAQTLFDQGMSRGKFRWGRKSKRMAGAALAIALRESKKGDALRDIAVSIHISIQVAISRAYANQSAS